MISRDINCIPKILFEECSKLKEFSIFVLPDITVKNKSSYRLWKNIIKKKFSTVFKRHKSYIDISIYTTTPCSKIKLKNLKKVIVTDIINVTLEYLYKNEIMLVIINNYTHRYGFLIVPGIQKQYQEKLQ